MTDDFCLFRKKLSVNMAKVLQFTQIHSVVTGHSCILRYNIRNTQFGNGGCKTWDSADEIF